MTSEKKVVQNPKQGLTRHVIRRTNDASMTENGNRKMTTVELGKTLDSKLKRYARREEMTISQVIRKAVRHFLAQEMPLPLSPSDNQ